MSGFEQTPPFPSPFTLSLKQQLKPLKEKTDFSIPWIEYSFHKVLENDLGPREIIRRLDKFKLHQLTSDESNILNLPSRRLNLHSMKDIMLLCGGSAGVRFETDDMKFINTLLQQLQQIWTDVDGIYKELPSSVTKSSKNAVDEIQLELISSFNERAKEYVERLVELQTFIRRKREELSFINPKGRSDFYNRLILFIYFYFIFL
jgi:hypothetical protein